VLVLNHPPARNREKATNVVEEVKEILLDFLADDELPAASAIFLAKVRSSTASISQLQCALVN